ncbi:MAG: hypothetical protein M5U23_05855 [Acidimicrobiia bacterium]|nr:hypothetical protein [Acidimicrobiia bacterium]
MTVFWIPKELAKPSSRSLSPMVTLADLQAVVGDDVRLGVTDCAPFPEVAQTIEARVSEGLNGGLGFTYAAPDVATRPLVSFPWGRSIVVAAVPYLVDGDGDDPRRSVARFADGDRYGNVRETLALMEGVLVDEGHRVEQVFDDDRLVDRAVAVRAGVAWSGKSTMALTPGHGPWFLIGSVVTDAVLAPSKPMVRTCGSCTACLPACPTGAIIAPGVLDASRCLAAVLQRPGSIPIELRESVGHRIYGCDDCLVACPPGDQALVPLSVGSLSVASSSFGGGRLDPASVLAMTDDELNGIASHWYVPKRNMRFVRRNALIAAGNAASERDVALLCGYLGHPDPLLRGHAAWALGRSDSEIGHAALVAARRRERDPDVCGEISAVLAP